jgi:hypothetical protein
MARPNGLAALAVLAVLIIGFEPAPPFGGLERANLTVTAATEDGKILRTRHVRSTGVGVPAI